MALKRKTLDLIYRGDFAAISSKWRRPVSERGWRSLLLQVAVPIAGAGPA